MIIENKQILSRFISSFYFSQPSECPLSISSTLKFSLLFKKNSNQFIETPFDFDEKKVLGSVTNTNKSKGLLGSVYAYQTAYKTLVKEIYSAF